MKITISNIAWQHDQDEEMYSFLNKTGITGIEIAPTRIFPENPYRDINRVKSFSAALKKQYNLDVVSLQSICFGRAEAVFGTAEESLALQGYLKQAIDFSSALQCNNLVFGSPKNRVIQPGQEQRAVDFFSELGRYAATQNTVFAIEPNPEIYGTNFITTTAEAFSFVKQVDLLAFKINFDLGTVLYNNEDVKLLNGNIQYINHVHISEPYLEEIKERDLHRELAAILKDNNYTGYVSVEMKSGSTIQRIQEILYYIQDVFKA